MNLSICIPSVVGREKQLEELYGFIEDQSKGLSVEIITDVDNKEVSIGFKRDRMYKRCVGKYAVQIDDDDWVSDNYVENVLDAIEDNPDCVGYKEHCLMDGLTRYSSFSLKHEQWQQLKRPDKDGIIYYRTPFTKSPIKTEICKRVGVRNMRFAEDHDFAKRVYSQLRKEVFIDEIMYYYSANSLTAKQFKERYGIK